MLLSMTGFGRAEATIAGRQVTVELKSLNGKGFDINTRLPYMLRAWELDVRSLVSSLLQRGTTDVTVTMKQDGNSKPMTINMELAAYYADAMKEIAGKLGLPEEQLLPTLMRMPEIVSAEQDVLPETEWLQVKNVISAAAARLTEHRRREGESIERDLLGRIAAIEALLEKILPLEPQRIERIRQRMSSALRDLGAAQTDNNRFEQELIYYIEKIDVSEEKMRLKQHCDYFRESVAGDAATKGKVLGFILQEVGREINTLGAKANDAGIQQYVVQMKDELEKAKEQVLNVL